MKENLLAQNVSVFYGQNKALHEVSLGFAPQKATALIGPSGLRQVHVFALPEPNDDLVPGARVTGEILLDGENVNSPRTDVVSLRRRVGRCFKSPTLSQKHF